MTLLGVTDGHVACKRVDDLGRAKFDTVSRRQFFFDASSIVRHQRPFVNAYFCDVPIPLFFSVVTLCSDDPRSLQFPFDQFAADRRNQIAVLIHGNLARAIGRHRNQRLRRLLDFTGERISVALSLIHI